MTEFETAGFDVPSRAVTRRRVLQASAMGAAIAALSACGAGGTATPTGSSSGPAVARSQEDMSDTEKQVNWSNWIAYLDIDEKTSKRPSLETFQKETGISVKYTEDINGNNEFYAKVRAQLEQGRDIGRDIVVLTDWMAGIWIDKGYSLPFDNGGADIPNKSNVLAALADPTFDPGRKHTLPWQSGFAGLGFNRDLLKELTGKTEIRTLDELWDPKLKGKVTVLDEMRDTIGNIMQWQGKDSSKFTDADFDAAIGALGEQLDSGQIRQVTGNDYLAALENRDVVAVIGWSGDVLGLGGKFGFNLPESGGTLWTDNMLIPAMAAHQKNAEKVMDYYYEPKVAAQVAAYVQYISPVEGTRDAIGAIDPSLTENLYIFPDEAFLSNAQLFMTLTPQQQTKYNNAFQEIIGG